MKVSLMQQWIEIVVIMTRKNIFISIILAMIISHYFISYYALNNPSLSLVKNHFNNGYEIIDIGNFYVIYTFNGSGSHIFGGTFNKTAELEEILTYDILDQDKLASHIISEFPPGSFDDPLVYIGDYDNDREIEIFYFGIAGLSIGGPFEVGPDGRLISIGRFWINLITIPVRMPIIIAYPIISLVSIIILLSETSKGIVRRFVGHNRFFPLKRRY